MGRKKGGKGGGRDGDGDWGGGIGKVRGEMGDVKYVSFEVVG